MIHEEVLRKKIVVFIEDHLSQLDIEANLYNLRKYPIGCLECLKAYQYCYIYFHHY